MATVAVSDIKRLSAMATALQAGDAEFILRAKGDEWHAVIPGAGNTCLAQVRFSAVGGGLPEDVGLNVSRFATLVRSIPKADVVDVSLVGNMLTVSAGKRKRSMAIYDVDAMTAPRIPNLSPQCSATLPCDDILDAVTAANTCANIVCIELGDGVSIGSYVEPGEAKFSSTRDDIECETEGTAEALFATDLLLLILRQYKGRDITLKFDSGRPIHIYCGSDECLIAPREVVE